MKQRYGPFRECYRSKSRFVTSTTPPITRRFDRRDLVAIAIGGLLGATLRWWITDIDAATNGGWFEYAPNATAVIPAPLLPGRVLFVNLLGTLLLGFTLARRAVDQRRLSLAVATGFCGSLTTFSTLAVELAARFRGGTGPTGHVTTGTGITGFEPVAEAPNVAVVYGDLNGLSLTPVAAGLLYLVISLVGGALAFFVGRRLGRAINGASR